MRTAFLRNTLRIALRCVRALELRLNASKLLKPMKSMQGARGLEHERDAVSTLQTCTYRIAATIAAPDHRSTYLDRSEQQAQTLYHRPSRHRYTEGKELQRARLVVVHLETHAVMDLVVLERDVVLHQEGQNRNGVRCPGENARLGPSISPAQPTPVSNETTKVRHSP